jgi:hypothetical protein
MADKTFGEIVGDLTQFCLRQEGDIHQLKRLAEENQKHAAERYDIREWLRACGDDPEGYKEFYVECCKIIFGYYEPIESEQNGT